MWLMIPVAMGWLSVALVAALAEATSPQGTVLGSVFTFLLYGALPLGVVLYLMATPMRARARARREAEAAAASGPGSAPQADGSHHPAGAAVPPEREIP